MITLIVAGALTFIHNANAFTLLLSGATAGFFVSYSLPVVGAAWPGCAATGLQASSRWASGPRP